MQFSFLFVLLPRPEDPRVGAAWRKKAAEHSAEKVDLLAVGTHPEAVFIDAAQVRFFVKKLAGGRHIDRHFSGAGQAALVTAQPAAAAQTVPVVFPSAVFAPDTRKGFGKTEDRY